MRVLWERNSNDANSKILPIMRIILGEVKGIYQQEENRRKEKEIKKQNNPAD